MNRIGKFRFRHYGRECKRFAWWAGRKEYRGGPKWGRKRWHLYLYMQWVLLKGKWKECVPLSKCATIVHFDLSSWKREKHVYELPTRVTWWWLFGIGGWRRKYFINLVIFPVLYVLTIGLSISLSIQCDMIYLARNNSRLVAWLWTAFFFSKSSDILVSWRYKLNYQIVITILILADF